MPLSTAAMSGQTRKAREGKQSSFEATSDGVVCKRVSGRTGRQEEVSRGCGCELLFGDGTMEDTLDVGPGVASGGHEFADELLGMVSWATCGLLDERDEVDVWT